MNVRLEGVGSSLAEMDLQSLGIISPLFARDPVSQKVIMTWIEKCGDTPNADEFFSPNV